MSKYEKELIKLDRLLKYREHFRKFHEFEDNIANQRISFLLTSQPILLVPHFLIVVNRSESNRYLLLIEFIVLIVLVIFALIICEYIKTAIETAFTAKDKYNDRWNNFLKKMSTKYLLLDDDNLFPDLWFKAKEALEAEKKQTNDLDISNLDPQKNRNLYSLPKYFQFFWLMLIGFDFFIFFPLEYFPLKIPSDNFILMYFFLIAWIPTMIFVCRNPEYRKKQ